MRIKMIRLDDLEAKANAAIPTRLPAEATMESLLFHQAIDPQMVLALIRVVRAAQISADDACIHADLYEALKEISE
jgi:hypothetical protein